MYCFNCMREAEPRGFCPHCGKQNVPDRIPHHLAPGTVLNGKYVVGNSLGEGGFGITYIGLDTSLQMRVAIKEYYPHGNANRDNTQTGSVYTSTDTQSEQFEKGKERFMREAQSVAQFSGAQGVVNIKNYFEENNTAYIIMEYLEGENLLQHITSHGNFSGDEIFRLMLPIMQSLQEIHRKGVIHRDISPDNIIYGTNKTLTLTDFGSARYFSNNDSEMSVMLKQGYAPEEQYRSNGNQGTWTDVYGLCATIYKCITGVTPQRGLDRAHIDQLKPPSELGADISRPLEAVLMKGLAVYHENRCQDMGELIGLTRTALKGQMPAVSDRAETDDEHTMSANSGAWVPVPDMNRGNDPWNQQRNMNRNDTYGDPYLNDPRNPAHEPKQSDNNQSKAPVIVAVVIAAIAVILAAVVLFMLFGNNNDGEKTETTATTAAETKKEEVKTSVKVPDLTGKTRMEAVALLEEANLDYEMESKTTNDIENANKVLEQSPKAGETASEGDKVKLVIGEYEEKKTEAPATEAPTAANKTMYCRASQYANLRATPSFNGTELARIPCRAAVEVLDSSGSFYKVRYNGNTGYVWKEVFSEDINAPLYTDEEESSQVISSTSTYMYCRANDYVTFRTDPTSLNGKYIIGKIQSGEKVRYISSTHGKLMTENGKSFTDVYSSDKNREFYKVEYGGKIGYVIGKFFSTDPDAPIVTDNW